MKLGNKSSDLPINFCVSDERDSLELCVYLSTGYAQNPTDYFYVIFMRLTVGLVIQILHSAIVCTGLLLIFRGLLLLVPFHLKLLQGCCCSPFNLALSPALFSSRPSRGECFMLYSLGKGFVYLSHPSVLFSSTFSSCCCQVIIHIVQHSSSHTFSTWCLLDPWVPVTYKGYIILILI